MCELQNFSNKIQQLKGYYKLTCTKKTTLKFYLKELKYFKVYAMENGLTVCTLQQLQSEFVSYCKFANA